MTTTSDDTLTNGPTTMNVLWKMLNNPQKYNLELIKQLVMNEFEKQNGSDTTSSSASRGRTVPLIDSCTPLMLAVIARRADAVSLLFQLGPKIWERNHRGETALHVAAGEGKADMLELLISYIDANFSVNDAIEIVNAVDKSRRTAMYDAIRNGHISCVKLLFDKGASLKPLSGAAHCAASYGREACLKLIIDKFACIDDLDEEKRTAMCVAAEHGHINCLRLLHSLGASLAPSPLFFAVRGKQPASIAYLISEVGMDVNEKQTIGCHSQLFVACHNGSAETVQTLINFGAEVNSKEISTSPLVLAVREGHWECVRVLIDNGADVNVTSGQRLTPLTMARMMGKSARAEVTVSVLLEEGAV